jgi:hypothetical protein
MGSKYPLNDIIKEEEKVEEGGGVPESHHHLQLPMTTHAELSYDLETMRMYFHTLLTKILTELPDLNTKWNNVRRDIHVSWYDDNNSSLILWWYVFSYYHV